MKLSSIRTLRLASLFFVLAALAACGDDDDSGDDDDDAPAADAAPDVDAEAEPDAGPDAATPPADCNSPFALPLPEDAETKARAALAALDPTGTAKLQWVAERSTIQQTSNLSIPVEGCTGDKNAYDLLFDTLEASPDLFQIDRADWNPDFAVPCSGLAAGDPTTLVIRRVKYGPLPLRNDVFSALIERLEDGSVILRNFYGTYIPRANPDTLAQLTLCPELAPDQLDDTLRQQVFVFATFLPPPNVCVLSDPGEYHAHDDDSLVLEPGFEVLWDDAEVVTIFRFRSATLRVAPANYTDDLINSDANCPDDDGTFDIGWIRFFDPVSGRVIGDKPAPKPGCIVC